MSVLSFILVDDALMDNAGDECWLRGEWRGNGMDVFVCACVVHEWKGMDEEGEGCCCCC